MTMINGGTAAEMMIKAMKNDLGKKLYGNTLTKNIGNALYKEKDKIEETARKQFPMLKACKQFQYGYKLADPKDVMRSFQPTGVVLIPEEEELKSIVDRASELMTDFTPQKAMDALKSLGGSEAEVEKLAKEMTAGVDPSEIKKAASGILPDFQLPSFPGMGKK